MALTPRLDQRQSQSLVMTPQLQQAIKLLQLSNMELTEFVEQELQENPMLERDEGDPRDSDGDAIEPHADETFDEADGSDGPEALESINFDTAPPAELPKGDDLDVDYENTYTNSDIEPVTQAEWDFGPGGDGAFAESANSGGGGFDALAPDLEQTVSEHRSLRDYLLEQLSLEIDAPTERMIGAYLVDMLDGAGYLAGDLESVGEALACPVAQVEAVLGILQGFDPPGIFARDLKECLALQLKEKDRLDPCMQTFLDNLDLLAARELTKLARICACDSEDITDMIAEIRSLNPKPALAFGDEFIQPVIPDVLMRAGPDGGWLIELNSETLPKVLVNNAYYARLRKDSGDRKETQYIVDRFQTANWLVKALHQRATTILKVATELIDQQSMFFSHGVQYLKPLVLRDIADVIEMHESTVSRVTSNKYMSTPRGIFELKYFFTASISATGGGEAHSAEAVRHRIKLLINNEPPNKILSDDKIVTLLKADGVDIARRTVAKYREAMRIPSSVQRRRDKATGS